MIAAAPRLSPMRRLFKGALRPLFSLLFRIRVQGDMTGLHAPRLLVVANHESFLDGVRITVSIQPQTRIEMATVGPARSRRRPSRSWTLCQFLAPANWTTRPCVPGH